MDFATARGRWAIVLAALVVVACSSSSSTGSSNGGESPGDGGGTSVAEGGGGGSSGYDAAVDYDAAVAACAPYTSPTQRETCCEQEIPRGYSTIRLTELSCLCGASGACASACDYQDCTSMQSGNATCESCLSTNLAGNCQTAAATACAADPGCVAYQACVKVS